MRKDYCKKKAAKGNIKRLKFQLEIKIPASLY
jgi:hypothetical protein